MIKKLLKTFSLILCGATLSAQAAGTIYTTVAGASGNWSDTTKWAGGVVANGAGNFAALGAGSSTFALDLPVTLGQVRDGQGSARGWSVTATGGNAITMDNTGGPNNNNGNPNAYLGSSSSGSLNFQPSIILGNSDLEMTLAGSTTPSLTIGVLGSSTITATAPRNIALLAQSGSAAGITVNSSIGSIGSSITVSNMGVGTRTATLAGGVGPNASIVQNSGTSTLRLSSGANSYTGATIISLGTLQLGIANAIPGVSSVEVEGTLNMASFSDTIDGLTGAGIVNNATAGTPTLTIGGNNSGGTFNGTIQNTAGTLSLTKVGTGVESLTGGNTYTGTTTFNGGILNAGSGDAPGSSGPFGAATAAGSMVFGGGVLQYSVANQQDYSSRFSTAPGQAIKIDTAAQSVTFAMALTSSGGSLTKTGNGTLSLTAAETYTGNTTVTGGTLALSGSGALAAASTVNIGAGGTFDVSALGDGITATYTLGASATLKASGISTNAGTDAAIFLVGTSGILDLSGSQPIALTWNGASAGTDTTNPPLLVTQGTLALNNNPINVVVPGTSLTDGVYKLISAAAITGTPNSIPAFSGGNGLQAGKTGVISVSGSSVILTVSSSGAVLGTWNVDADGNWNTPGNWSSNPNVPRAAGSSATLGVGSALRTVTVNAAITNGTVYFTNDNSFVVASGGSTLTLDNAGAGAAITVSGGTQNAIATALALNDNTAITITSNKSLSISGAIGNSASAKTLTVNGGTLTLAGNNSYGPAAGSVGTTLLGGTLKLGNNSALGAGDLNISSASTLQAGAAGLNLNNNIALALGVAETIDNNGNNLTLGGVISGSASLLKIGTGTLTLNGASTYSSGTTVNAGAVSVSADGVNPGDAGNLGAVPGSVAGNNVVLNGGDLLGNGTLTLHANRGIGIGPVSGASGATALIDAASGATFTIAGSLASAGNGGVNNLTVNSLASTPGTLILGGANTFNGTTVIANGALQLANSLALQNSSLNYNTGTLLFDGSIAAATLGGLSCTTGTQTLGLTNIAQGPIALTVGGNGSAVVFNGNLIGSGGLVKAGNNTMIVSNANYTGGTTIFGGSGVVTIKSGNFGSSSSPITVGSTLQLTNATVTTASTFSLAIGGGQTGVGATIGGAVSLTNTTTTIGSGANTAGGLNLTTSGNVNLGDVAINKDSGNVIVGSAGVGLVINGANVLANSVNVAQSGTGSRGADLNINSGTLTIADPTQAGKFALNASSGIAFMTMTGGTLNYLGTDGLLISIGGGNSYAVINGGTANLTGVTLNSGNAALTNFFNVGGTSNPSLYLGNVGLVINAPTPTIAATFGTATIGALTDWASDAPITLSSNTVFKAADAANVPHGIILSNVLSGVGGFSKTGAGTLTLFGATTYSGNTVISNGVLALGVNQTVGGDGGMSNSAVISIVSPGILDVSGRSDATFPLGTDVILQTLAGNGTLNGSLTVGANGTVAPGFPIGTLTVTNVVTLGGNVVMDVNRAGSPSSDKIAAPVINAGGTLTVNNIGAGLHVGDTFQLFSTSVTGAFAVTNLVTADTLNNLVYTWTNKVSINGTVAVLSVGSLVNTNVTAITNSFDGTSLTLTWPTDHIGWRLQVQTNSLATGLSTNWSTVAGSSTTNQVIVPVDAANGSVFYRLVYP